MPDAAPDHWGRRVIQRHVNTIDPPEIDYLLQSPDNRASALGFGLDANPPAPKREFNQTMDLGRLQAGADAILADEVARREGVSERDCERIAGAFAYSGYRYG